MTPEVSQYEQVRRLLLAGWCCGTLLLDRHIPRYSAVIHELKQRELGLVVERRRCQSHSHHRSGQYEWRLQPRGQGSLL
jgi:hypothetical protein